MQKKNKKIIGFGIVILAVIILLLVLIFLKDIVNKQDKNKLAVYENTPTMLIGTEPNVPKLSAGMIPIKWNGENFVITTKDDSEWYNSKPAYMMLNDGYYKSELERGIKEEQLANNNVGVAVLGDPNTCGTIFMWVPRFVYNADGEIGYIKEETTPGDGWTVPELFMYKVSDETKADFSLTGVWVEKDVDTAYSTKISQMNQEESIYKFIANTKATQITTTDTNVIQKYVDNLPPLSKGGGTTVPEGSVLTDPTNLNRIILKIINNNQYEPIKANITHNTVDKRIEIRVTYTANGINSILDEYGEQMTLTEENGLILADTGASTLGKGTYKFTVIDNKGNKQELSIEPTINSLFKVAYINGTDNMDNLATYNKSNQTVSNTETTLLNQIQATDTTKTFSRAIQDSNKAITAIGQRDRNSEDEQKYLYRKYSVKYDLAAKEVKIKSNYRPDSAIYGYLLGNLSESNGTFYATLTYKYNAYLTPASGSGNPYSTVYTPSITPPTSQPTSGYRASKKYYKWVKTSGASVILVVDCYECTIYRSTEGTKNSYLGLIVDNDGAKVCDGVDPDTYWYEKGDIIPRYTLYKYDSNLALQSAYDVETKILTTEPVDISNKDRNKVKLTLTASDTDYKTYISNDNTNWQEVTEITSGTPKELDVDGWDNLYIKIETNSSTITNIDIAYYKD